MSKPVIEDFTTVLTKENMGPLFDTVWDALEAAKSPEAARDVLIVYSKDETYTQSETDALVTSKVERDGDTMTGPLTLQPIDPALDNHAARKAYVDRRATEEAEAAADAAIDFPFSTANPGYIRLPGGILIQFGTATTVAGSGGPITFPQPFTAAGSYVAFGSYGGGSALFAAFNHVSATSMQGHIRDLSGNSLASTGGLRWCAIGY